MDKKKKIVAFKGEKKCALCGKKLRYTFEEESGVCENCQMGKKPKIKTFEQFTYDKK